jgi:hypothetical protein
MTNAQPWWLTMSPEELAVHVLPFLSTAPYCNETMAMRDIVSYWWTGAPAGPPKMFSVINSHDRSQNPDIRAVAEAVQVLEHARLIMRLVSGDYSDNDIGLTRLGMHALSTNTVRQHVGLGDPEPKAPQDG